MCSFLPRRLLVRSRPSRQSAVAAFPPFYLTHATFGSTFSSWVLLPDNNNNNNNENDDDNDESNTTTAAVQQMLHSRVQQQGYCVTPQRILSPEACQAVKDRLPALFRGDFDTGVYPDEWHWRQGLSLDHVTREICNAWKSDRTIASIVLHPSLGRFVARIMEWDSVRLAQDDVIWKPPTDCNSGRKSATLESSDNSNKTVVGFHQDSAYISSQFEPYENNSVTVWMALDDADEETGCIEYAPGSHLWRTQGTVEDPPAPLLSQTDTNDVGDTSFHASNAETYRQSLPLVQHTETRAVQVRQGHAVFHHQDVWHGSGPNRSTTRHRRALVAHYLRGDVTFRKDRDTAASVSRTPWGSSTYIYGRYKRFGSVEVDESFFPIIYACEGSGLSRTCWLDDFVGDKER